MIPIGESSIVLYTAEDNSIQLDVKDVVRLMSRTYQLQNSVTSEETDGLLTMIGDYVYALDTLDHLVVKNHSFSDGNKRIAASCSCDSWTATGCSMPPTATSASPTTPWWPSR